MTPTALATDATDDKQPPQTVRTRVVQPHVPMDLDIKNYTRPKTNEPETIAEFLKRVQPPEIKWSTKIAKEDEDQVCPRDPNLERVKAMLYFNASKVKALVAEIAEAKIIEEPIFRRYEDIGGLVFFKSDAQLLVRLVNLL